MPEVLVSMGRHWSSLSEEDGEAWRGANEGKEVPSERMPRELVESLIRSRSNRALFWLNALHVATFDMAVHQPASREEVEKLDTTFLWNSLRKDIVGIDGPEVEGEVGWGHGQATSGHLVRGYDAGYYSYLT